MFTLKIFNFAYILSALINWMFNKKILQKSCSSQLHDDNPQLLINAREFRLVIKSLFTTKRIGERERWERKREILYLE